MSLWKLLSTSGKYLSSLWHTEERAMEMSPPAASEQLSPASVSLEMPQEVFVVTETYLPSDAYALQDNRARKQILAVFKSVDEASEYAIKYVHRLELRAVDQDGHVSLIGKFQGPADFIDLGDGTLSWELDWYNKIKVFVQRHGVFDSVDPAPVQTPVSWIPYCPPLRPSDDAEKVGASCERTRRARPTIRHVTPYFNHEAISNRALVHSLDVAD